MPASSAVGRLTAVVAVSICLPAAASAAPPQRATLLAVGDVASCTSEHDERVAGLVSRIPGTIALLGDIVYDNGTEDEFSRCFLPSWGRLVPRIRAALGNHDYANGASDAAAARRVLRLPTTSWYSYELGSWHVIVLDSNCALVGGCNVGSAQWHWLRRDLGGHRGTRCTLAYWHHPRFSSGHHGSDPATAPLWNLLTSARADVVLAGHDHHYERFAPISGIRSFVIGTGGRSLRPFEKIHPRSVARSSRTYGALRLTLRPSGYAWRYLTASGASFADAGAARCE